MGKKILVVEDEKALSQALKLKLAHEGFEVTVLGNGEGVIQLAKSEGFSIIVSDLIMPKVDGFQVLKMLKDENIKTPVIIVSNLSQQDDESKARNLGAVDFLIKSDVPLSKIVDVIKTRIGK